MSILYDTQKQIVDILKLDEELTGISILAENSKDIEFEIQSALGNQGIVAVVMTPSANFIGNYQDKMIALELDELTIQIVENVSVNRGKKESLTGQDAAMRIMDWLSSPKYGRQGQFNPVSYEQGEDNGLLVNKVVFKCAVYNNDISLIKIKAPTSVSNLVYNGEEQIGIEYSGVEGYTLNGIFSAIDAGTYSVIAVLNEGYIWDDDTTDNKIINWSISTAENEWIVEPSIDKTEWYENETGGIITNGISKFGDVVIKINNEPFTSLPEKAGVYVLDFIVNETNNFTGLNYTISFEILEVEQEEDSLDTPLTFTSVGGVSTIKFTQNGSPRDLNLEYSLDNGNTWIDDTSTKTYKTNGFILNDGEKLMLRATDAGNSYVSNSSYSYHKITTTTNGEILVNGNIQTLLDKTGQRMDVPSYCYCEFFNGSDIKTPPMLPATTLANDAYRGMFGSCVKMVKFPELPATNLANQCYGWFYGGQMTENNEITLPAETLKSYCYRNMIGASNIKGVTINVSSVDSNVNGCFAQMFYDSKYLEYVKFPNLTYTQVKTLLTNYGNTNMFERIPSEQYPLIKIICSDGEYTLQDIKG